MGFGRLNYINILIGLIQDKKELLYRLLYTIGSGHLDKKSQKPVKPVKKSKDDEKGGSKRDRMRDESSEGASVYDLFDPEEPQGDFSFTNPK